MDNTYQPPEVWTMEQENGGVWGSINRPDSGVRFEQPLPVGKHPLQLYSMGTPNGQKVTIMLEELLAIGIDEAQYDAFMINIGAGEQFGSGFVEINPNSKIPALVDMSLPTPLRIFESGNILLYLAEKFQHFLPGDIAARTEVLNWLFWLQGSAPYLGGGFGHFYAYAPQKYEYPINRFAMETKRQLDVLNKQLATHRYIAGDDYTIADMAVWPWYGNLVLNDAYGAGQFLDVSAYTHLQRWAQQVSERRAVQRGRLVNRDGLPERHSAADIDAVINRSR